MEYIVEENYQQLYRRALNISKQCYETGMITASMVADGNLYTDIKEGEVYIYLLGGLGRSVYHGATFKAIDDKQTKMTIFSNYGGSWYSRLKKQYTGECQTCSCE